jgi:hypothetical protein
MDDKQFLVIENPTGQLSHAAISDVQRISLRHVPPGLPIAVTLWHSPSEGTRFESTIQDLVGRLEAGVLTVTKVYTPAPDESFVPLPALLTAPWSVEILVLYESGFQVESGATLRAATGAELTIVAGAMPCTLAVLGLGDAPHRFEPEYDISVYTRRRPTAGVGAASDSLPSRSG